MNVTAALYSRLAGDSTLTALLSTYSAAPAIFTSRPVPPTAARPYIVAAGSVADVPFDAFVETGREITRDVVVICDNTGSASSVEAITERVRTVLHRAPLAIAGAQHVTTLCTGITTAPTDDSLTGRILTFRIVARAA